MFDSIALQLETSTIAGILGIVLLIIIALWIFAASIKIIREYERVVQFRLGRLTGSKGPGVVLIFPIINRLVKVDLRERYLEVPHQTAITKDNAPVDIDFLIYYKVVDASASIVQVQNFTGASVGLATTTLRAVVGDIPLDELLSKREQINSILRTRLDEVTERWGIKVTKRLRASPCSHLLSRQEHRRKNNGSPIPRCFEGNRKISIHQVHISYGVHEPGIAVERFC